MRFVIGFRTYFDHIFLKQLHPVVIILSVGVKIQYIARLVREKHNC